MYTDLFAGNLKELAKKLPYLKEQKLTYLHLMPLLQMPVSYTHLDVYKRQLQICLQVRDLLGVLAAHKDIGIDIIVVHIRGVDLLDPVDVYKRQR